MAELKMLTKGQKERLARCWAHHCGVGPNDDWKMEMNGSRRFIKELCAFWKEPKPHQPEQAEGE